MEEIKGWLKSAVLRLFGVECAEQKDDLRKVVEGSGLVMLAPESSGADYATNIAMRLAKMAYKSPMSIAEELRDLGLYALMSAIVTGS